MNVLSKPLNSYDININYILFFKDNISLKKYKIPELKKIAKENNLHVSGSKPQLIDRIEQYFLKCKKIVNIQKIFRGHIVKKMFILRGIAFKNRKICVNETDFYTLEPLEDIPHEEFYSYTDEKNFTYGFNIQSLMSLYKQKGKIVNPYNRETVEFKKIRDMFILYHLCKIIFPAIFKVNDPPPKKQTTPTRQHQNIRHNNLQNSVILQNTNTSNNNNNNISLPNNIIREFTPQQNELYLKMQIIREKPINIRVQELFIEIDLLGNYTQSSWFNNLEKRDLTRLYRYLHDIWCYRGQINYETKKRICSLYDPFLNNNISTLNNNTNSTDDDYKRICLNVMETMVYTGIDVEYQKIGTLHMLSALTIVSPNARQNMMWLYESLLY
jgi:hypothetical protein